MNRQSVPGLVKVSIESPMVNVEQDHEVRDWSEKLGVSQEQLRSAVAKAGPMVKNVRDPLQLQD